jgi:glutamine synthetase
MVKEIRYNISSIVKNVDAMTEERKKANEIENEDKRADAYCNKVRPYFEKIRNDVDKLELLVDDEDWPLPKYRELLFLK